MKSLGLQGNGCTAFDENGEIVYRFDNYDNKHCSEVFLTDLSSKVLFTLSEHRKGISTRWKGCATNGVKPMFRVRKSCRSILRYKESNNWYKVSMGSDGICYRLQYLAVGKSPAFRITDSNGRLVAEAKRKQSSSGVVLEDDILSLVVEPHAYIQIILLSWLALVTVYGLIKRHI